MSENIFTIRDKQRYTITIHMKDYKPTGFTAVQANGTIKATNTHAT